MGYEKEKQVAIAAVTKAAKLCVKVQRDRAGAAIEKPDQSPVTIADLGAQAVICQAIAAAFSDAPVVETARRGRCAVARSRSRP